MSAIRESFKRALVTGGAGFIGSHIVHSLLDHGIDVVSVDDYSAGKTENLTSCSHHPGFTEARRDVTDMEMLRPLFDGVDIVFHQACSKNTVCLRDPARDLEVNARGTLNMLLLAREFDVKKFVHASTGSVYGEAQYYPTDENHPLNPVSYYGVSKLCGEKYVRAFSHLYGMDTTILRYFHVFGPRQEYSEVGGVVSIFGRRALFDEPLIIYGDGTQMRSFTFVSDVVRINELVAVSAESRGQVYNCASGVRVTIQELAEAVLRHFKKEHLPIVYEDWKVGDIKKFDIDNSKIRDLGFSFEYSFERGLSDTLEWLRDYFDRATITR